MNLSEEQLQNSDDFSVTVTLNPDLYIYSPQEQIERTKNELYFTLNCLCPLDWIYTIELTKAGNVHYHIYIVFPHERNMKKKIIQKSIQTFPVFGHVAIRRTYDRSNWISYMHKNEYNP